MVYNRWVAVLNRAERWWLEVSAGGLSLEQNLIRSIIMIESNALFAKIKDSQNRTQVLRGYL